jgi:hypothetical protein
MLSTLLLVLAISSVVMGYYAQVLLLPSVTGAVALDESSAVLPQRHRRPALAGFIPTPPAPRLQQPASVSALSCSAHAQHAAASGPS